MLLAFFVMLSLIVDYKTVTDIAQSAFRVGLVNISIFACTGVLLAIRRWLTNRNPADSYGRRETLAARSR